MAEVVNDSGLKAINAISLTKNFVFRDSKRITDINIIILSIMLYKYQKYCHNHRKSLHSYLTFFGISLYLV